MSGGNKKKTPPPDCWVTCRRAVRRVSKIHQEPGTNTGPRVWFTGIEHGLVLRRRARSSLVVQRRRRVGRMAVETRGTLLGAFKSIRPPVAEPGAPPRTGRIRRIMHGVTAGAFAHAAGDGRRTPYRQGRSHKLQNHGKP